MRKCILPSCGAIAVLLAAGATSSADSIIDLGAASNYAILFEGGGNNTLQITNVTTNTAGTGAGQGGGIGNIGVGGTGKATVSGPSTVGGSIGFSASNTGQFSSNNASNVINGVSPGTANFNVAAVASALNTVNALNTTLGALAGTNVSVNSNTTINASAGTFSAAGTGYTNISVFHVTSFSLNNGQNLTINGDGIHSVVLDFTSNTNFHGNVVLTGGLTPDQVVFNFVGGSALTGGPTLDLNNGGGSPSNSSYLSQGIFLDPNGPVSVTNSNVRGRIFGGDSHDFQYVSGSNVTAPPAPLPSSASAGMVLLGGLALIRKLRHV
jgi:hypothetical protein